MLKTLKVLLVIWAIGALIVVTFVTLELFTSQRAYNFELNDIKQTLGNISENLQNDIKNSDGKGQVVISKYDENAIDYELAGVLRKEKIPSDLQLGDYWYIFYFDEPFLLMDNATGTGPLYIRSIQLFSREDKVVFDFEDYVNKKVKIAGNLTWGYAESRVFKVVAITDLE